jgi:AcrR family transcriptional regulator
LNARSCANHDASPARRSFDPRTEPHLTAASTKPAKRTPSGRKASSNAAGAATRDRLLAAAERLVARSGVDGVSTREILVAAEADSAAIHYHFGSKDALMAAVFMRRQHLLRDGAKRHLDAKMEQGIALTARDIAEAIVLPIAELADDAESGRHYLGFIMAMLHYPPLAHLRSESDPWMNVLMAGYREIAPRLSNLDRRRRIGFSSFVAIGALSDGPPHVWFDRHLHASGAMVDALLDFITSGLAVDN